MKNELNEELEITKQIMNTYQQHRFFTKLLGDGLITIHTRISISIVCTQLKDTKFDFGKHKNLQNVTSELVAARYMIISRYGSK